MITWRDFHKFCSDRKIEILRKIAIATHHRSETGRVVRRLPDWFAKYGICLVSRYPK